MTLVQHVPATVTQRQKKGQFSVVLTLVLLNLSPEQKPLISHMVYFFNTRVQLKGLQAGCSTRSVHARPGLARQCFSFIFSSLLPLLFATALDAESAPADVL